MCVACCFSCIDARRLQPHTGHSHGSKPGLHGRRSQGGLLQIDVVAASLPTETQKLAEGPHASQGGGRSSQALLQVEVEAISPNKTQELAERLGVTPGKFCSIGGNFSHMGCALGCRCQVGQRCSKEILVSGLEQSLDVGLCEPSPAIAVWLAASLALVFVLLIGTYALLAQRAKAKPEQFTADGSSASLKEPVAVPKLRSEGALLNASEGDQEVDTRFQTFMIAKDFMKDSQEGVNRPAVQSSVPGASAADTESHSEAESEEPDESIGNH